MMNAGIKKEIHFYRQAIALERVFPRKIRKVVKWLLYTSTILLGVIVLLYILESSISLGYLSYAVLFVGSGSFFFGTFLMSFALMFLIVMLSGYYNAHYYRGIESITREGGQGDVRGISYEVSRMLDSGHKDLTVSFLLSSEGRDMIARTGLDEKVIDGFIESKENVLSKEHLTIPDRGYITIEFISDYVLQNDQEFKDFMLRSGVSEDVYAGASNWIADKHHHAKYDTRWWSRDNLGKVPVLGKEFSYGSAFMLERYARDIKSTGVFSVSGKDLAYTNEIIEKMESALARTSDANVVLVGEQGVGKMDIVMRLNARMHTGDSAPNLQGKQLIVFDAARFIAEHENATDIEDDLIELFVQAAKAGNVVIAIDRFGEFLSHAASSKVAVASLMDQYLASSELQFIVTCTNEQFHSQVESKPTLLSRFEKILVEKPDLTSSIHVLQSIADELERKYKIVFTYPSIAALAEAADRYITDGVMPEKAVLLLGEIAPVAARAGVKKVTKEFVNDFVSNKTGVPMGEVKDEEREKLLNLEEVLHERVIGQRAAIDAISGVMRRARAGVGDADRPLGSFMFLGSTGVGKTETAKALAHVFFGAEAHMSRIDMSEYSGEDALKHLIGDGKNDHGSLPVLLKEKPYGVLLLDEFEKANSHVHDLFLQIIDEGFFTDAKGHKINGRNNIIIATSNAGAGMIWELAKDHKNPNDSKEQIIESIIKERIYKPELINRFDGVIVFEPLKLDEQEKIARIMLEGLKDRIKKKGYELVIDEVLISLLVEKGYDPEFGARPMRRVLQDEIEEKIATKIIEGNLKQGDKIWFYAEDFKE